MSKFDGRKLSYACLHYPIFVPDCAQVGPTLTQVGTGTGKAIDMTIEGDSVVCVIKGKTTTVTLLIPKTSFTHTVLAPE